MAVVIQHQRKKLRFDKILLEIMLGGEKMCDKLSKEAIESLKEALLIGIKLASQKRGLDLSDKEIRQYYEEKYGDDLEKKVCHISKKSTV